MKQEIQKILRDPLFLRQWLILFVIVSFLFLFIQIIITPSLRHNPKVIFLFLGTREYFFLISLAILVSFNLTISFQNLKRKNLISFQGSLLSFFSSLLTFFMTLPSCISCFLYFFGFLGSTSAIAITAVSLKYRDHIILLNFIFLIVLSFINLRNLQKKELKCKVNLPSINQDGYRR